MHLPPLPLPLPPGWTIDSDLECSSYIHADSALPYLETHLDREDHKVSFIILDYIATHASAVMESSTFLTASVSCFESVLSHSALSLAEDDILSYVMKYATHAAGVRSVKPVLWNPDERIRIMPILSQLIPRLAVLSLSSSSFLRYVEPLDLLPVQSLIFKYKYDALLTDALASGRSEREMVLEMYGGSAPLYPPSSPSSPRVRAAAVVSESAHPYESSDENELEHISVAGWAGQVIVEFDRRSCVAADACLSFYGDSDGRVLLADWSHLWHRGGDRPGGKKFLVFQGHQFWVGFKCPARPAAGLKWGWKLRARPVIDESN